MGLLRLDSVNSSFTTTTTTTTMATARLANNNTANSINTNNSNITNTTTMTTTVLMTMCQNGSVPLCQCVSSSAASNTTRGVLSNEGSLDALLYIVVVLLFYAFSIVVLMVKYIRRENKEAYLRQYFDDFVAREHFQSARARNQICLKTILDKPDLRGHFSLDWNPGAVGNDQDSHTTSLLQEPTAALFCIPETISELVEDDEEVEFESAEDELLDEQFVSYCGETEKDQVNS